MLRAFVVIVCFQFAGEALSRLAGLPVPGPVVGGALLLGLRQLRLARRAEQRNLRLLEGPGR